MRSSRALAIAAVALFAIGPAQPGPAGVILVHVCGGDATIPLPVPAKKSGNGSAPCHGSAPLPGDKKRLRLDS